MIQGQLEGMPSSLSLKDIFLNSLNVLVKRKNCSTSCHIAI